MNMSDTDNFEKHSISSVLEKQEQQHLQNVQLFHPVIYPHPLADEQRQRQSSRERRLSHPRPESQLARVVREERERTLNLQSRPNRESLPERSVEIQQGRNHRDNNNMSLSATMMASGPPRNPDYTIRSDAANNQSRLETGSLLPLRASNNSNSSSSNHFKSSDRLSYSSTRVGTFSSVANTNTNKKLDRFSDQLKREREGNSISQGKGSSGTVTTGGDQADSNKLSYEDQLARERAPSKVGPNSGSNTRNSDSASEKKSGVIISHKVVGGLHGFGSRRMAASKVVASKNSSAGGGSSSSSSSKTNNMMPGHSKVARSRRENWGVGGMRNGAGEPNGSSSKISFGGGEPVSGLMKTCESKNLMTIQTIDFEDADVDSKDVADVESNSAASNTTALLSVQETVAAASAAVGNNQNEKKSSSATNSKQPSSMFSDMLKQGTLKVIKENDLAVAFYDKFPVTAKHALVITKRVIPDYWAATSAEKSAIWKLVDEVKQHIDKTTFPRPHGYNVGFNAGTAAGQTVFHLHVHVIPRYSDDCEDATGGVRNVIPGRGMKVCAMSLACAGTGGLALRLGAGAEVFRPAGDQPANLMCDRAANLMSVANLVAGNEYFVLFDGARSGPFTADDRKSFDDQLSKEMGIQDSDLAQYIKNHMAPRDVSLAETDIDAVLRFASGCKEEWFAKTIVGNLVNKISEQEAVRRFRYPLMQAAEHQFTQIFHPIHASVKEKLQTSAGTPLRHLPMRRYLYMQMKPEADLQATRISQFYKQAIWAPSTNAVCAAASAQNTAINEDDLLDSIREHFQN